MNFHADKYNVELQIAEVVTTDPGIEVTNVETKVMMKVQQARMMSMEVETANNQDHQS